MIVEIRTGRSNVYEITLLLISLAVGINGMINGAAPGTALSVLGPATVWAFYVMTFVGSATAFVGLWLPSRLRPVRRFEASGLITLAGSWIGYGVAVVAAAGEAGVTAASLLIGFGCANLCRVIQIRHDVRQSRGLTALISEHEREHE